MSDKEAVKALIAHRIRFMDDFGWDKSTIEALDIAIASLSTESKPVVKGEWIIKKGVLHSLEIDGICSKCGYTASFYYMHNFCPNCGADMRKEAKDE